MDWPIPIPPIDIVISNGLAGTCMSANLFDKGQPGTVNAAYWSVSFFLVASDT